MVVVGFCMQIFEWGLEFSTLFLVTFDNFLDVLVWPFQANPKGLRKLWGCRCFEEM